MKKYTVFYAWQSDTEQNYDRHPIRNALDMAAEAISGDPSVAAQVIIDSDTQGVAGEPHVTQELLRKISEAEFFAPHLTFVGRTDGGKLLPNPNVLIEYGYAMRVKPTTARMSIMNTEYGPPEELPFDRGFLRFPITYKLPPTAPDSMRRTVRAKLAKEIEVALRLMISTHSDKAREEYSSPAVKAIE